MMENVLTWIATYWPALLAVIYGLVNVTNGVLKLIPGDQWGEDSGTGFGPTLRKWLDRLSVLTSKDGGGTLKLPGTSSQVDQE